MSIVDPAFITSPKWPRPQIGEPAWQVAFFFPAQGHWTEADYLALDRGGGRLVELVNGRLEVLPMPTFSHQKLVAFLFMLLNAHVKKHGLGEVVFAPMPVHLSKEHYREPDIVFMRPERIAGREYPELADLLMEVVSADPESRQRDLQEKRRDYALAGIPEYWIIDPEQQLVTVLALDRKEYRVHGEFKSGQQADSPLLPGFDIDVAALFAAGKKA
jgi:Uma2 family endonuclease